MAPRFQKKKTFRKEHATRAAIRKEAQRQRERAKEWRFGVVFWSKLVKL